MARAAATAAPRTAPRRAPAHAPRRAPATAPKRPRRVSGRAVPAPRVAPAPRGARVLDRLLTGRLWIGLVGVLLAGIVFFNVDLLRLNRDITHMADRTARLKRENARYRADLAVLANSERIQEAAAELGLVLPAPSEVRYLKSNPGIDARNASKRIIAPQPTEAPDPIEPTAPTVDPVEGTPVDPATGLPVDPETGVTMYSPDGQPIDPATGLPVTTPPTTTTPTTSTTAASPTG
jgi:cell division protein FtsL